MNRTLFIKSWSAGVGAMDAITGILLIITPQTVLKLLGIAPPDDSAWIFLSWMGVFITGVGLSYFWAISKAANIKPVWQITALIRLLVAAFISWKTATGELQQAWLIVAVSDAIVAIVQIQILRWGWWKEVDG